MLMNKVDSMFKSFHFSKWVLCFTCDFSVFAGGFWVLGDFKGLFFF